MSQYNKTVLTHAGLELAKRANAGQAKFGITRAVTSADDWSNKTVQDLEEVTTIPNIMQQGIIMDTDEVESNNSVIGVSLCFTNKNLSTGYRIRIIGLYVKEEGQENDFLYAVTTAITPEYMPDFNDKVLYRFNMQMYLVIGNAQSVNVVINDGTAVTHGQFDKYKAEVTGNLKKLENTHKEDMSHVAKSASINGGAEILPDSTGKLNLVVPDPDLSKYVSLEQLGELLKTKADKADVYTKTETDNQINNFDLSKVKFRKQYLSSSGNKVDKTWSATKNDDGTYTIDLYNDDWTAAKLRDVIAQLPSKANASDVSALQNSAMQVIDGNSGDDILSFRDEKIRCYNNVQNVKNLPSMSITKWFYVITHTKDGWGNVTVISQDNCYWQNVLNGSNWSGWVKHATSVDITDLQNRINTKANASDLSALQNSAMQVIDGNSGDDILSFRDEKIRCYNNVQNVKNLPSMSITKWFYVITHTKDGWGNVTVISQDNCYWQNVLNGSDWSGWVKHATSVDITDLQNRINTKANASDLSALDSRAVKSIGIFPNDLNFTNGQFTNWSNEVKASPDGNGYALIDLTDDTSARAAVDQLNAMLTGLNHLQGKHTKDSADANDISKTGIYYCSNPVRNFPVSQWGTLVTNNGNGERASQFYFPDDNSAVWFRTFDGYWRGWVRLANIDDVNNAKSSLTSSINAVNDSINAVNNKVNVAVPLYRRITASNTWNDILGTSNGNPVLVSIRDEGGANTLGNFAAAVAFGGEDAKGVLNVAYVDHTARIIGGNGDAPVWHEDIAWKSDVSDLRNQIQQLRDNQFEVQTFTDATAAANWEAQRPGKRMAIVNS